MGSRNGQSAAVVTHASPEQPRVTPKIDLLTAMMGRGNFCFVSDVASPFYPSALAFRFLFRVVWFHLAFVDDIWIL